MAILKFKNSNGEWLGIPAFKGEPGKDGAVQYKAGDGIKIENDTITADVTKDYIDDKLEDLGGMGFTPEIAESLPTENIDEKTIYMIPGENGSGDNIYEEWMHINNKWEMIGSTSVDLSNYYTKDEIEDYIGGASNIVYYRWNKSFSQGSNVIDATIGDEIESLLNSNIEKTGNVPILCIINKSNEYWYYIFRGTSGTNVYFHGLGVVSTGITKHGYHYQSNIQFGGKYENGLFNFSSGHVLYYAYNEYLELNNTKEFTPSSNYQPATKKYVDNAVAGIDVPESNIVSIDISGFLQTAFSSGSGTGYASSNESVKAGLEKIARLGAGICIIQLYNRYSSMLCVYSNSYTHSDGGWGAYYTGSYQTNNANVNGTKATVTTKYASDGTPQNIKISFDSGDGFVIKDNVLVKTNTTSFTPSADYHPATKKYVDDALANIPQGSGDAKGFYTYKMNLGNLGFAGEIDEYGYITHILTELCKTETNDLVNKILTDDINQPLVVIENTNTEAELKSMLLFGFDTNYDPAIMQNLDFTFHGVANYIGSATGSLMMKYENSVMFSGTGIVTDGVWDATAIGIAITTQQSLTTDNTWEYTPTGDYNPATKKYVDEAVAGASGGITSESDPVFKASEAYKITSTDTANWNSKVDLTQVNSAINSTLSGKSYLTSESDPTVPSWAKQPNKPTYTASEVGALPASTVIPTVPTKLSGFTDDLGTSPKHTHSQYLTTHQDISSKQNKVLYGISDPTSDIGTEGDVYIKYV